MNSRKILITAVILLCVLYFAGSYILTSTKNESNLIYNGNSYGNTDGEGKALIDKDRQDNAQDKEQYSDREIVTQKNTVREKEYINPEGMTVMERYLLPEGFERMEAEKGSFAEFLRKQKLKPYGQKALYYDGREKPSLGIYNGVLDVDIGNRDLHQCADAIMLLRAEYLYSKGKFEEIAFDFVSGFRAEYSKWMEGYRIKVNGNDVKYYKATDPSNTYKDFRKYMDMVMAYANTLSLEKELKAVDTKDIEIGDVLIIGGSPGHAVIVMDMAISQDNKKIFLLAQSYMPAQQTQILINPMDESISPWYSLEGKDRLITPEWTFGLDQLRRFDS